MAAATHWHAGAGCPRSTEELMRTLREDAETVLRGIDALRELWPKEVEPPRALAVTTGSEDSTDGSDVPFPAKPALDHRRMSISSWLQVPPALVRRWDMSTSPKVIRSGTFVNRKANSSSNTALQLDNRWKDLFVSNELEMDLDEQSSCFEGVTESCDSTGWIRTAQPSFRCSLEGVTTKVPLRPHGSIRITWDLLGLACLMYDFITVPFFLCWGLQPSGRSLMMVGVTAVFWSTDILMNFHTGFFKGGLLQMSRKDVTMHYVKTWLILDVCVVMLDFLFLAGSASISSGGRLVRVLRLARVAKISKLNSAIEDLCATFGIRWLILVMAIVRNLTYIFMLAHMAACLWYYIGRMRDDQRLPNWLQVVDPERETPGLELYVRSLYWVLGHLTAAPVDPDLSAQSHMERTFTLILIFFSLLVLGAGISSMTNTIAELGKLNSDFIETKRQLQSYLKAARVGRELSTRIVQFALHSYTRRCALSLDAGVLGLLSEQLKSELAVSQRSRYFLAHPLFQAVQESHQEVFQDICERFTPNVYADEDVIFHAGRVAKCMYVTHQGVFRMRFRAKDCSGSSSMPGRVMVSDSERGDAWKPVDVLLDEPEWICEVSLYTKFVHQCTLNSVSFSDAFTFSAQDLLHCVTMSPRCVAFVYRYAQEYLGMANKAHKGVTLWPLEMNSLSAAERAFHEMQKSTQPLTTGLESPDADFLLTQSFLQRLRSNTCSADEMCSAIPQVFMELHESSGLLVKLLAEERNRTICSMRSVILLVKDRYTNFVAPQSDGRRLSLQKWQEWQDFVRWVDIPDEHLHAALVFLAIRGLGKVKSFSKALPVEARAPEDIVLHLMDHVGRVVPSVSQLSEEMRMFVQEALHASKCFSLPQLLQGENTPSQVELLKNSVSSRGEALLKFLLLCQVGVMCGIIVSPNNTEGSAFMDETNSTNILKAISFLRKAACSSSHAVYWGYILSRGQDLGLPTEELDQIALCRLACLCRTSSAEKRSLQDAWEDLSAGVRRTLIGNLLADGIQETAFVFIFLPQYLANAKANSVVGLRRALEVLVDLLEVLRAEGCAEKTGCYTIAVDLQEMAAFAKDAVNPRVFQATSAHVKVMQTGSEIQILLATKHKERMKLGTWAEDQELDMPSILRKLERKVDLLEVHLLEPGSARHRHREGSSGSPTAYDDFSI